MRVFALIVAATLLAAACTAATAQTRSEIFTCSFDEFRNGENAVEIVIKDWHDLEKVTYLSGSDPREAIEVMEFYDGGIVKALYARYSPALTFRMEVYRDRVAGDGSFVGMFWPIASSQAFAVTCTRELQYE